jgi:hypothetical protein
MVISIQKYLKFLYRAVPKYCHRETIYFGQIFINGVRNTSIPADFDKRHSYQRLAEPWY